MKKAFSTFIQKPMHIAPLVIFRIAIGAMLILSTLRFLALGWVSDHYIEPIMHFSYFGFEWVKPISAFFMYFLHGLMLISAVGVMTGWLFRLSSILLFLSFTYIELIDLTYYLNHYYFVSLVLLLLIFTPAHRSFSLDARSRRVTATYHIPRFYIFQFQLLIGIVYTFAGLAKINREWLFEALPLKIWLPAADAIPVLGHLFSWQFSPYIFSWVGMIYDCTIVWWLAWAVSRPWAFVSVIAFHILTGILFQIGVFPLVMIGAALIFFSEKWHLKILEILQQVIGSFNVHFLKNSVIPNQLDNLERLEVSKSFKQVPRSLVLLTVIFFAFQIVFPWRYLLYPGNTFWSEQGYRFSWRVMLMEKAGTATFYVKDALTGREGVVVNSEFLNPHQEKQMAMQPDLILQFAHFLHNYYRNAGMIDPAVRAEVYVTLNARPSKLLIDPTVNLAQIDDSWQHKSWIQPVDP